MIGSLRVYTSNQQFLFEIPIQNFPFSLKLSEYEVQITQRENDLILKYSGEFESEYNLTNGPIAAAGNYIFQFHSIQDSELPLEIGDEKSKSLTSPKRHYPVGMDLQLPENSKTGITSLSMPSFDAGADIASEHPLEAQKNLRLESKNKPGKSGVAQVKAQAKQPQIFSKQERFHFEIPKIYIFIAIGIVVLSLGWTFFKPAPQPALPANWEPTNQSTSFHLKAKWMETVIEKVPMSEAEKEIERLFRSTEY
ncbi:MAG: hypothetical protein BroJett040_06880 [Oligoflexia bacterium]|nr:MAG: hypothetical protein BroJett040_06880 [Oligoflexia bacterium]